MRFKNRQPLDSNHRRVASSSAIFAASDRGANDAIVNSPRQSPSRLVFWLLLMLVGGGLVMVSVALRRYDQFGAEQDNHGPRPISRFIQLYSSRFVIAVKNSRHDFLADYDEFYSIWNEASPHEPMMLRMIRPAAIEPISGRSVQAGVSSRTEVVDRHNFAELRPLLMETRTLILEGDGSGSGKLPYSGYEAEPAELELEQSSDQREVGGGSVALLPES